MSQQVSHARNGVRAALVLALLVMQVTEIVEGQASKPHKQSVVVVFAGARHGPVQFRGAGQWSGQTRFEAKLVTGQSEVKDNHGTKRVDQ